MNKKNATPKSSASAERNFNTAQAELERARQCFHEIVADLDLPEHLKLALLAAAGSWAKAAAREVSR